MNQPKRRQTQLAPWQDASAKPFVRIVGVTKTFGTTYAVDDLSLDIFQGEFFSLLGGSGCGKSTLLRILAGFVIPDQGRVSIDGVDVTELPPYLRPVNMMFQSYALFPHMNVADNVAFGLKQEGMAKAQIDARVAEMLDLVKMSGFAKRKPDQLSGGQRQRVALARSLAKQPKLLLLDEPLGALDRKLREHTQLELVAIQERVGTTFVTVTHDQEEAMTMSTRVAIMDAGRIVQVNTPSSIYEFPATRLVADFLGSVNLFDGRVIGTEGDDLRVRCDAAGCDLKIEMSQPLPEGTQVSVALRPEKISVVEDAPPTDHNWLRGQVSDIAYLGDVSIYHIKTTAGQIVRAQLTNTRHEASHALTWDDEVVLRWSNTAGVVLTA
jgi:putrescine transport system ATP-binding protein